MVTPDTAEPRINKPGGKGGKCSHKSFKDQWLVFVPQSKTFKKSPGAYQATQHTFYDEGTKRFGFIT
jgi:hypothetical protein